MSDATYNRFNEVAATSMVQVKLDALKVAVTAPTTKVYQRQRVTRRDLWREMAEVCLSQANALDAVGDRVKAKRRAMKSAVAVYTDTIPNAVQP